VSALTGFLARRLVTCDARRASHDDPLGLVHDGAIVIDGSHIVYVGPRASAPSSAVLLDVDEHVVTPGLIDAHTHTCFAGSRHVEYAMRMAGSDYRAIAEAGGGIVSTAHAVADASEEDLAQSLTARLRRMARLGVTCVEVKSGYGLTPDAERKQLRAIARAARNTDLPAVIATFLGLHTVPEAMRDRRAAYVRNVAEALVPEIAAARLALFVDAYIDENAFAVAEARAVFTCARAHGLGIRMHIGQFADVGGAELAAELGALSVDHLEHVSDDGIARLAASGCHATLLPIASFTLGQAPPPIAKLRAAGVPMVVASDANPGTAPSESLPLALAFAVRMYGLTPAEAILGATRHAACSLGLTRESGTERGVLRKGARADVVTWDLPHELALVQPWGTPRASLVLRDGVLIAKGA
jgi:imidazolonepropionase